MELECSLRERSIGKIRSKFHYPEIGIKLCHDCSIVTEFLLSLAHFRHICQALPADIFQRPDGDSSKLRPYAFKSVRDISIISELCPAFLRRPGNWDGEVLVQHAYRRIALLTKLGESELDKKKQFITSQLQKTRLRQPFFAHKTRDETIKRGEPGDVLCPTHISSKGSRYGCLR